MAENDPRFEQGVARRLDAELPGVEVLRAADDSAGSRVFDCLNLLVARVSIARPNAPTLRGVHRERAESVSALEIRAAFQKETWDQKISIDATAQFLLDHRHGGLLQRIPEIHLAVAIALAMF